MFFLISSLFFYVFLYMIYPVVVMGICEDGFSNPQSRQTKGSALVDPNSIESLNISTRAKGALFRARIHTVDILVMYAY